MSLTAGDLVVFGPFGISILATAVEKLALTGIKGDSLVLNIETKLGNSGFEDGTEEDWEEGRKLVGEIIVSEFNTTDLANLEDADNCVITMDNGKVITFGTTVRFFGSIENGKMKIMFFKTVALGNDLSGIAVIS